MAASWLLLGCSVGSWESFLRVDTQILRTTWLVWLSTLIIAACMVLFGTLGASVWWLARRRLGEAATRTVERVALTAAAAAIVAGGTRP